MALKWAVTEQFHKYLSPYGKNRNEFVVRTDNNPLTYIFSSTCLNAAGHRWVANLADYNFSLEYQRGKDNTVADFLSQMEDRLPEEESNEQIAKIPEEGVRAVLDNARIPIMDRVEAAPIRAEAGLDLSPAQACLAETLMACPAQMTTLHVTNLKQAQKDDPTLNTVVKNLRSPLNQFKDGLKHVLDQKSIRAFVKARENLTMKNGLLYHKLRLKATGEDMWHFVVPKTHRSVALGGCHHEAAHQGQCRSFSLMQEQFWWPGMAHELKNHVKNCVHCKKFEGALPITKLKKLPCSSPGEILHIDYTSIEETVDLSEKPVIHNVLVMQDHFSKHVVAYVVKDQKAKTAAKVLGWGYFGLFGAPAYLVSDQGGAFTGKVVESLVKLYRVQKLRTSSYHTQTNGQVEWMNQTLICMIGKLDEEKKACWSEYLPELLLSYNSTCSAVTGYRPHFLIFSRRPRIPVDYQFPTIHDLPHRTKLEESVADLQKRLKEAFEMARCLTSEEAVKQQHYYDCKAGAAALQPRDIVMVQTDRFVGKHKVKDRWEEGGFVVVKQLDDWPVYKVQCPPTGNQCNPTHRILHQNCLMLVPSKDDTASDTTQLLASAAVILNACMGTLLDEVDDGDVASEEEAAPESVTPSLLTHQGSGLIPHVWLNGEFCTQLYTQMESKAVESQPESIVDDVSDTEPVSSGSEDEEA